MTRTSTVNKLAMAGLTATLVPLPVTLTALRVGAPALAVAADIGRDNSHVSKQAGSQVSKPVVGGRVAHQQPIPRADVNPGHAEPIRRDATGGTIAQPEGQPIPLSGHARIVQ